MTPAEQARAEVEAWFLRYNRYPTDRSAVDPILDDLISRLTPVFERAQVAERGPGMKLYQEVRERAERAEAQRDTYWQAMRTDWQALVKERETAEADAERLREALRRHVCCSFFSERDKEALAATEPKA